MSEPRPSVESDALRYHPQVKRGGMWGRPSVGGIDGGFPTIDEARSLIAALIEHDGDYYARCEWRVLEVQTATRVLPPGGDRA